MSDLTLVDCGTNLGFQYADYIVNAFPFLFLYVLPVVKLHHSTVEQVEK